MVGDLKRAAIEKALLDAICARRFPRAVAIDLPIWRHLQDEASEYADAVMVALASEHGDT